MENELANSAAEHASGIPTWLGMGAIGVFAIGFLLFAILNRNFGLVVGVALAGFVHFGFLYAFNGRGEKPPPPPAQVQVVESFQMPELEPPEIDLADLEESSEAPPEIAPPSLMDVPTTAPVTAMTIPYEPPPPDVPKNLGAITIPVNRPAAGSGWGKLFDPKDLDQQPQPTYQVPPQYPFEMKRAGQSGTVTIGFIVDASGNVRDAYVVDSTHRDFEQPALQAVQKWRFRAGRKAGKAVNTRMQIPIVFNIKDA